MSDKVMKAAPQMQANEEIIFQNLLPNCSLIHDGYPNATPEQIQQIKLRPQQWFTDRVGQPIQINSIAGLNGFVAINNNEEAIALHELQASNYRFMSKEEREAAVGELLTILSKVKEPVFQDDYLLKIFVNGIVDEAAEVRFMGLTANLNWYCFYYINNTDTHLLPVGNFPAFLKRVSPELIVFEQYSPLK